MFEESKLIGYPSIDEPWLKYYSEEAINASLPECTIYEYLYENNKDHLDDTALNYFGNKITYGKLFESIEKAAKGLSAFGLKNGDIILIASVTIPEVVYAFYACNRLGIIPNMVDPRTSAEGIREYITEVNAKAVITIDVAYAKIEKAAENTSVKKVITVSPADSMPHLKAIAFKATHYIKRIAHTKSDFSVKYREFISNGKNKIYTAEPYKKDNCSVIVHGMSEVCSTACVQNTNCAETGSVGIPLPHVIISAFDIETGKEKTIGDEGEICINSPSCMLKYVNNEDETQNIMRRHPDGKVWIHTGDLGYISKRGSVFITGRIKRIYITKVNGTVSKIFPDRIEKLLSEDPAVSNCCVVCTGNAKETYKPVAFIVLKQEYGYDIQKVTNTLKRACKANLPDYAQPIKYIFKKSLPLTSVGKIDYRALEKRAEEIK